MLVLSRKHGECIVIDGGVTVRVIEVAGNRVRLGIEAPKEISILRSELGTKIQKNERTLAN
jgi:carbon storage regulator